MPMTLAEKLRTLREKAGLTQDALAEASGVPLWTIRNYEQGRREPNWKGIIQLARALGVGVEVFADCVEAEKPGRKPVVSTAAPPAKQAGKPAAGKQPRKRKGG